MNRRIEILSMGEEARDVVRDSELGRRTVITRDGREVAIVISFDEYVALHETVAISGNAALRERIARADDEAMRGALTATVDLPGLDRRFANDRLRVTEAAAADWNRCSSGEREQLVALFERIDQDPLSGVPLFEPLRPWWSCREAGLRIVYRVTDEGSLLAILAIDRNQA